MQRSSLIRNIANSPAYGSVEKWEVERRNEPSSESGQAETEAVALLYIRGTEQSCATLRRAARRIRGNVRRGDGVWWSGTGCAIVLPGTPLEGAQAVARRIFPLLADVECELQILHGQAALALLERLQAGHATPVEHSESEPPRPPIPSEPQNGGTDELPYLAFLAQYPSLRLLQLFPYELAHRHRCIPIGMERGVLTLATYQRLECKVVRQLQKATQRTIFQVRCDASIIDDVLQYWQRTL